MKLPCGCLACSLSANYKHFPWKDLSSGVSPQPIHCRSHGRHGPKLPDEVELCLIMSCHVDTHRLDAITSHYHTSHYHFWSQAPHPAENVFA